MDVSKGFLLLGFDDIIYRVVSDTFLLAILLIVFIFHRRWSGDALGRFQYRAVLLILVIVGQGPTMLAVDADRDMRIFFLSFSFQWQLQTDIYVTEIQN